MWVIEVDEEKAKKQGITPADVTKAVESLGEGIFEVLEILQEGDS